MKVLAVGDVHQKPWIVNRVEKIAKNYDKVVFCGDYLDNWGATSQDRIDMINHIKSFSERNDNVVLVSGNHDLCYHDKRYMGRYTGWDRGTQMSLDHENWELKKFLRDLPQFYLIDGITYSHAGKTTNWTPDTQPLDNDGHMWVRPDWGYIYQDNQVFGHTPSQTCWEVQPTVWCIDSFSQYPDGRHFGDCTVLEVIDGKEFNVIPL